MAVEEGSARDEGNNPILTSFSAVVARNSSTGSTIAAAALGKYPVTACIPTKNFSQFVRELDFPMINNHFLVELEVNIEMPILRAGAITACTLAPVATKLTVTEIPLSLCT